MSTTCPRCKGRASVEHLRVSLDGGQTFTDQQIYRCSRLKEPCKPTKVIGPATAEEKRP